MSEYTLEQNKLLLSELYIAYFDRAPDADGLDYWLGEIEDGNMSFDTIASNWANEQTEFTEMYGSDIDYDTFITQVYSNVLGRAPDSDGAAYWKSDLEDGSVATDKFILAIINGAKADTGSDTDTAYLNNRAQAGIYFADSGQNDVDFAKKIIKPISSDDNSLVLVNDIVNLSLDSTLALDTTIATVDAIVDLFTLNEYDSDVILNIKRIIDRISTKKDFGHIEDISTTIAALNSSIIASQSDLTFIDDPLTLADDLVYYPDTIQDSADQIIDLQADKTLIYSTATLVESDENNGVVPTQLTISLVGDQFAGSIGKISDAITVSNLPEGMSYSLVKVTDQKAIFVLTDSADSHEGDDSITDLTITFNDDAFVGGDATAVTGNTKSNISIVFEDTPPDTQKKLTYSKTTFSESTDNDGSITLTSTITLANDTFLGGIGEEITGITVTGLPDGMSASIIKTGATTATLSFVGNATTHTSATVDASIVFGDTAFYSRDASDILNASEDLVLKFLDDIDPVARSFINNGLYTLPTSDTEGVSALQTTYYWQDSDNSVKDVVTYSFVGDIQPTDYNNYAETSLTANYEALTSAQRTAFRDIFTQLESIIDVDFEEVDYLTVDQLEEGEELVYGDILISTISMSGEEAGFAFYPGDTVVYEGDIFLSSDFNDEESLLYNVSEAQDGWYTMVHELGHALGLTHSFEAIDGTTTLDAELDDANHTVMTYTTPQVELDFTYNVPYGNTVRYGYETDYIYPEFFSIYDVAALQATYGANEDTNKNDTTYTLDLSDSKLMTIWDAGGDDTIDLSTTDGKNIIDLTPGSVNSADYSISFNELIDYYQGLMDYSNVDDPDTIKGIVDEYIYDVVANATNENYDVYYGENNLAIAYGVVIENLITGSADDSVTDNFVDNEISTGAGDDKIYLGAGGYDVIDGGDGTDTIYLDIVQDAIVFTTIDDKTYMINDTLAIEYTNIEQVQFSDTLYVLA
jgi:hypothetical protein